jgi:arginyl-tRNA--protein-N-Asp/Glu arginylyltransferase
MAARAISLYRGAEHSCPYLPGRTALSAFVDPALDLSPEIFARLLEQGFRRSGPHVYRPMCPDCTACRAVRIPVAAFRRRRSQRRAWEGSSQGLEVTARPASWDAHHFALYQRYLATRHPDGEMAASDPEDYRRFLFADWCETRCVELRIDRRLLAVAVTDVVPGALSAVYTFFDPAEAPRSPGVLAILAQIELARHWRLAHVYLGYWIGDCQKMRYKGDYRPLEVLVDGAWRRVEAGEPMPDR